MIQLIHWKQLKSLFQRNPLDVLSLGLSFGKSKPVNTSRGPRLVSTAVPNDAFWKAWQRNKDDVKASGLSVGKNLRGDWEVAYWQEPAKITPGPTPSPTITPAAPKAPSNLEASKAVDSDLEVKGLGGTLKPFQRAGVSYALKNKRVFIADEMGLGKTVQALATIQAAGAYPALVVCPATLKLNWEKEAKKWLPGKTIRVLSGGTEEDRQITDITILNYDILKKRKDELKDIPYRTIVFDESHYLKNYQAQRTKEAKELAKAAEYRIALTGTPILNRPQELMSQLQIVGKLEEMGGFWYFAKRYCNATQGRYGWDFSGASNLQELNERLRATGSFIRREKSQVLPELPEKTRVNIPVEIDNKTEYRRAERDLINYLREKAQEDEEFLDSIRHLPESEQERAKEARGRTAAAKARRAEELVKIETTKRLSAEGKKAAVKEWIESFLETGRKLVVFAHHRDVVEDLAREFNAPTIMGGMSADKVEEAKQKFQNDPNTKLIVMNIQAGGVGHTLTAASDVAFVERAWSPMTHDQAEDRVHRIGQRNAVTAYYFDGVDTIDERIGDILEDKRKIITTATEGEERVTESVLSDLKRSLLDIKKKNPLARANKGEKVSVLKIAVVLVIVYLLLRQQKAET